MIDEAMTIHQAGGTAVRLAELLREVGSEQSDIAAGAAGLGADELAWRQATRAVELCRRAAELAARR
jgi:hypothetical protein